MNDQNPYRSPATEFLAPGRVTNASATQSRQCDGFLIVPRKAVLPSLCARCGMPTEHFSKTQQIALMMKERGYLKGSVKYYLCEHHSKQRREIRIAAWLAVILGVAVWLFSFYLDKRGVHWADALLFFGALLFIGGLYLFIFRIRILYPRGIDSSGIWLSGLPEAFFADVPPIQSADGQKPIVPSVK